MNQQCKSYYKRPTDHFLLVTYVWMSLPYTAKVLRGKTFMVREENSYLWGKTCVACL